jgi:CheY-like chemotaxis protein
MFQRLFERSADAIVLFDPQEGVFVDCNEAAVALMRAGSKEALLRVGPADLAPLYQPDGRSSREKAAAITQLAQQNGSHGNLVTILRLEQYQPLPAENGAAGVELARREIPDLILCDVMMPALDGYGVLKELHNDPTTMNIPFIFLTAKGERADVRSGMNLGA